VQAFEHHGSAVQSLSYRFELPRGRAGAIRRLRGFVAAGYKQRLKRVESLLPNFVRQVVKLFKVVA
jgi:hypothetical protein